MTLQEIFEEIQKTGKVKESRLAHLRSSVNRYALALGCSSPSECDEKLFVLDKYERERIIKQMLGENVSFYVLRNTKNDISFLLREAQKMGLIGELPDNQISKTGYKKLARRKVEPRLPAKINSESVGFHRIPYGLPFENWDEDLRREYEKWKAWVSGEAQKMSVRAFNRPATIETKTQKMEAYFGYLKNIRQIDELDFEMLIDIGSERLAGTAKGGFLHLRNDSNVGLLEEFVLWHQQRDESVISQQAKVTIGVASSVARDFYFAKARAENRTEDARLYLQITKVFERVRQRLKELSPNLPSEVKAIRFNRDELFQAAKNEFPSSSALSESQPGNVLANQAGRALAIMLLIFHPLRNRNLLELKLQDNIFKNDDGVWIIKFSPAEQKTKTERQNKFEIYESVVVEPVIEFLEKYITDWHPRLVNWIDKENKTEKRLSSKKMANSESSETLKRFLFLKSNGLPYSRTEFIAWIERGTYRWLGVRLSPDQLRETVK